MTKPRAPKRTTGKRAPSKSASPPSSKSVALPPASTAKFPQEWREFFESLISNRVRFLIVGAHALALHGRPRATFDLDIFKERLLLHERSPESRPSDSVTRHPAQRRKSCATVAIVRGGCAERCAKTAANWASLVRPYVGHVLAIAFRYAGAHRWSVHDLLVAHDRG